MAIPKIIHQTWKSDDLPFAFRTYQQSWRRYHPDWEYCFYDDAACRQVIKESYPELLELYDSCPHPVQRADIFRYLVVALRGGLYADIDMECLRNIEPLLVGQQAVFCVEDRLSPRRTEKMGLRHAERIANFIFATELGHPFLDLVLAKLLQLPGPWDMQQEVLETTGPGMLTDVVQENRVTQDLTILPRVCWAAPTWCYPNRFPFNLHMYARHHFSGTWKDSNRTEGGWSGWQLFRNLMPTELYYRLPPSPIWKSDLCFWKRKGALP